MQEKPCGFGSLLLSYREKARLTQSRLGILAELHATHLRMIEKGKVQPSVGQAVRLVSKLTPDVGKFFQELAEQEGLLVLPDVQGGAGMAEAGNDLIKGLHLPLAKSETEARSIFGLMFKEVRLHYGITQKAVAEKARYNLRNLLNVESGSQEPGIITALAMVCATGADVEAFFEKLYQLL